MSLIIFDFDGTIADSLDVFVEASNRLARSFGYPQVSPAQIPEIKNLSSQEALERASISAWKMPFFLWRFRQELRSLKAKLRPIDGICPALTSLHQQGYRLGIVSSNTTKTVEEFLLLYELRHQFEFVCAGQSLLGKSRTLRRLLKQHHLDPSQVIYIGDETRDIEAARQAEVWSIAVSWGFNSHEVLASYSPDRLIDQPNQLLSAAEQLLFPAELNPLGKG